MFDYSLEKRTTGFGWLKGSFKKIKEMGLIILVVNTKFHIWDGII